MGSPVPERPGLLIRDPFRYSDMTLIIPPALVECLEYFDGRQTELDLRQALVRLTGDLQVTSLERHLIDSLSEAGFLENEVFAVLKEQREKEFGNAAVRRAVHAGSAYPDELEPLRVTMTSYMDGVPDSPADASAHNGLCGVAAPHVSLEGGWRSYRAAYRVMGPPVQGAHVCSSWDLALWRARMFRIDPQALRYSPRRNCG